MLDDSDGTGADVVLLFGCPQSCVPNTVEGLLEAYGDMVEVLLVLEILFTEDSQVEDLLCVVFLPAPNPACSSAMIFSACIFSMLGWLMSYPLTEKRTLGSLACATILVRAVHKKAR